MTTSRVRRFLSDTGLPHPSWGEASASEVRRGSSSDPTRFFSPRRNSRIGFGDGWVYWGASSSISLGIKRWRVANLFEKEKGHNPRNDRESRRHSAREEIWILLQKPVVTEHVREPFRRTRKCAPNDGPIPNTRSWVKGANSMLRTSEEGQGDPPQSCAGRPSDWLVRISNGQVCRVSHLDHDAFNHSDVAVECTVQSTTENPSARVFNVRYC
jgi:hypothetical protein